MSFSLPRREDLSAPNQLCHQSGSPIRSAVLSAFLRMSPAAGASTQEDLSGTNCCSPLALGDTMVRRRRLRTNPAAQIPAQTQITHAHTVITSIITVWKPFLESMVDVPSLPPANSIKIFASKRTGYRQLLFNERPISLTLNRFESMLRLLFARLSLGQSQLSDNKPFSSIARNALSALNLCPRASTTKERLVVLAEDR